MSRVKCAPPVKKTTVSVLTLLALVFSTVHLLPAQASSCSAVVVNATSSISQSSSGLCLVDIQATTNGAEFQVPAHVSSLSVVIIGGGGGGGAGGGNAWGGGGGGGAGQVAVVSNYSVTPGSSISIAIGSGGTGGYSYNGSLLPATRGSTTSFGIMEASGGAGGANHSSSNGGSGGSPNSTVFDGTSSTFTGGAGRSGTSSNPGGGGGGAGAGGNGANGTNSLGGNGGLGFVEAFSGDQIQVGAGGKGGAGSFSGPGSYNESSSIPATLGGGGIGSKGGVNAQSYGGPGSSGRILVFFEIAPTLSAALTPSFDIATKTADGFTVQVTNYDANFTWNTSANVGTAVINGTGLIVVAGLNPGESSTVTVTTTRSGYSDGSATFGASALSEALTPAFGIATKTADGFTVQVTNYDANFTWNTSANAGAAAISGTGLITVTGLSAGASALVTVTTIRSGYRDGTATVAASASTAPTWTNGQVDRANTTTGTPIKVGTDGDSVVTINGSNFSTVTFVAVGGVQASFSAISNTKLVFNAPANSVGTYDLEISNGGGTLTKSNYIQYLARPALTTDAVINGPAVASQSLTISASTWTNWNSKQYSWYRCETQVATARDGVPDDCSAIGWGGSTYELRSADICKFVTLREDLNNGGVYAPYRTVISTTRVLASASPWVLVTDGQNSTAETCSTTSSTVPVATTKSGVNFVEWNTAADGSGSAYQPGASLSLTGNLQLYAIYTAPNSMSSNTSIPTPTYTGPKLAPLEQSKMKPGASVSVEGSKLDTVHLVSVDGIHVEILHQTPFLLELQLPTSVSPGLKDLVLVSDYGKLTVLAFLEVQNPNHSVRPEANSESKITIGSFNGYVAVYLKGHEGDRLSVRVAGEWIVVNDLPSDFERVVNRRQPGELVDVFVYINRRLVSETTQMVR